MLAALGNSVECLVCMEVMASQIRLCQRGHSICANCANRVNSCPLCNAAMTATRNYKLEDIISSLNVMENKFQAFAEYRNKFNKRKHCHGDPSLYHYITNLRKSNQIKLQEWNTLTINQNIIDSYDIQLVPYNEGSEQHKVSVQKKEVYWLLQYLEPKLKTNKYCYEIKLINSLQETLKMVEVCVSEDKSMEELINAGKCITVPFNTLNKYLREDRTICYKFSIVEIKEEWKNFTLGGNQASSVQNYVLPNENEQQAGLKVERMTIPACQSGFQVVSVRHIQFSTNQNARGLLENYNFPALDLLPQQTVQQLLQPQSHQQIVQQLRQELASHLPILTFDDYENYDLPPTVNNDVHPNPNPILDLSNHSIGNEVVSRATSAQQQTPNNPTNQTVTNSYVSANIPTGVDRRHWTNLTSAELSNTVALQHIPKRRKIVTNVIPEAFIDLTD